VPGHIKNNVMYILSQINGKINNRSSAASFYGLKDKRIKTTITLPEDINKIEKTPE